MEKLKIKISEVEGMTIKIPTEFTSFTFKKFYDQMMTIAKSMPKAIIPGGNYKGGASSTPERLTMAYWQDKNECLELYKVWTDEGKGAALEWIKENKDMEFTPEEISKMASLMCAFRQKYKEIKK